MTTPTLRDLYALAYLAALTQRRQIAPADPATRVRVDDTGRAPFVPLRPAGPAR